MNSVSRVRALQVFALSSFAAVALGALVMQQGGVSPGVWLRNPVAWMAAGGLCLLIARLRWPADVAAPAALALIALSLLAPGQEGVHRWLDLGPVQLNAAALVLPAAIATFMHARAWIAAASFASIAALLAWQPDRSQLAAFAVAAIILATARFGWRGAAGSAVIAIAAMAICLSRADPLEPVPHVEGIFLMAWAQSPALAAAMAIALSVAALSPAFIAAGGRTRGSATALAAYFAVVSLAWLAGAYPVPLAGYGLSFVIGWWLGIAALPKPPPPSGA